MLDAGYAFPEKESGCDELTGGASHKLHTWQPQTKKIVRPERPDVLARPSNSLPIEMGIMVEKVQWGFT